MIRGVILDVDGTLLLSNDAHARAWVDAFAEFGYDVPFESVRPLIGMGGDKLLGSLVPGLSTEEGRGKELSERRLHIFLDRYAPGLLPAPGARELVLRIQQAGLRTIVGTSAKEGELKVLLQQADVADLLTEATSSSDVDQAKPAPDIVQSALDKLQLAAAEVRMLGDTPYDVESAGKAGVGVIAVRCGGWDDRHLAGALAVYNDPADLLVNYERSPLV